jgi:predicted DNA-binding transcriptional regulator AlpA
MITLTGPHYIDGFSRGAQLERGETMEKRKPKKAETPLRQMLNIDEVVKWSRLSRTTIFRREKDGTFPAAHFISTNRRVWFLDDLENWQTSRTTNNPRRGRPRKPRRPRKE